MNHRIKFAIFLSSFFLFFSCFSIINGEVWHEPDRQTLERRVERWFDSSDIPGMSVVVVRGSGESFVLTFGEADVDAGIPVSEETVFELGSCSKGYTALAVLQLEAEGKLGLEDPVSRYIEGFVGRFDGEEVEIEIRHLLHHTSGIPWSSVAKIVPGDHESAVEETMAALSGIKLQHLPGAAFEYATVNYDVLAAVVQRVSGIHFERYLRERVLRPLGLENTWAGTMEAQRLAVGYKYGFFAPRRYDAPRYRANIAGGYVAADAGDMARWLQLQLGLVDNPQAELMARSRRRDESVAPSKGNVSYAMGWEVSLRGDGAVEHSGQNPNFTSYVGLIPGKRIGVAVMTNSNSGYAVKMGKNLLRWLSGMEVKDIDASQDKIDMALSIISFVLALFILVTLILVVLKLVSVVKGASRFERLTVKKLGRTLLMVLALAPYVFGIYILPKAALGVDWPTVLVWAPGSALLAAQLLVAAFAVGLSKYLITLCFPNRNRYLNAVPVIVLLGMLSGFANTGVLFLITTSFYSNIPLKFLLFYFVLAFGLYVFGTKVVATKMINITNNITLDMRIDLINKIMSAKYQNFEKLLDGRIFTTLNDDTAVLARSANLVIGTLTSLITAVSAFIYLTTISFKATLVVMLVVVVMTFYYYLVSKVGRRYMERARDTQNVYMSLLNSLIKGYKELSMHLCKKTEYRQDLVGSCRTFRDASVAASLKFLNANIIGNSFIMIILGVLSIVVPRVLSGFQTLTLISYIMVLLYLIGPIGALVGVIPGLTRIKVSWDRIKGFIKVLDVQLQPHNAQQLFKKLDRGLNDPEAALSADDSPLPGKEPVESIVAEGVEFEYVDEDGTFGFAVGPIDISLAKGEILFIIGGNGSGKTTLAKVLTGLYIPTKGGVKINGSLVADTRLGEYYTAIFSDYHLFQKIYEVDFERRTEEVNHLLKILDLERKVKIEGGKYSTISLSGGQRKRLALMQSYLEDCPIFLMDEFAANQDPQFRRFFYRELLPELKRQGKIIIAVTHDDHYFDVADHIVKLDMGKIDFVKRPGQAWQPTASILDMKN
jgi:cyclic peptide transporter